MVAFSVNFYWYQPDSNLNYTHVVYDNVLLNIGSGYKSDGIFYCPKGGIYVFSVYARARVDVRAISNGMMLKIKKHLSSPVVYFKDSISLVLELNAGDKIWVEYWGFMSGRYIFTGHLMNT
ncbi:hypothetical protein KUTeg_010110 [Tegillarca granosa]|uniref:C1q domain-containing protein n=1 Tax=Tegillarca granosa TaxID=220873 RepID=A0ABQ9F8R8_TEGGR|nr:hypothetical protein KUTeg_010110 [Tegillarca granosa]